MRPHRVYCPVLARFTEVHVKHNLFQGCFWKNAFKSRDVRNAKDKADITNIPKVSFLNNFQDKKTYFFVLKGVQKGHPHFQHHHGAKPSGAQCKPSTCLLRTCLHENPPVGWCLLKDVAFLISCYIDVIYLFQEF